MRVLDRGSTGWIRSAVLVLVLALPRADAAPARPAPPPASGAVVVLGGDREYRPFTFIDADGHATGHDVELFRAVAREARLTPRVELGRWDDVVAGLESGRIHMVAMFVSEERGRRFRFSEPFLHRYHAVFGRTGAPFVRSLDALAGRRVAVQSAGLAWEELGHVPAVRRVPVEVEGDAVRAVVRGDADYALVPTHIGHDAIRRGRIERIVMLSPPLLELQYAYAISPRHAWLVQPVNAALAASARSGERQALYLQWLANLTPPAEGYRSGLALGLSVAALLLGVAAVLAVWWRAARRGAARERLSRAAAEARATDLERYDPVTRLMNRNAFRERMTECIATAMPFAVIKIELMDLRDVEAMAGRGFADDLQRQLAARLLAAYGQDMVARVGETRLGVLDMHAGDAAQVRASMLRLTQSLHARSDVAGVPVEPSCCAGAALYPEHGDSAEELLRAAGIAASAACTRQVAQVVYDPSLEPDPRNLTLLVDLKDALREGSLGYALQPKLDLASGRITGAELLVRWQHPRYGALSPMEFVPLAERTELIGEMTVYLVRCALAHGRAAGFHERGLQVSVNVSVNDLSNASVIDRILDACREEACGLALEITETAVMRHPDEALRAIERLRACGLRVSLDDFGTGNASLTYLRQLRPDEVKVDRSFTLGVCSTPADQSIVHSTIQLAHSLGARVTAEGVEDGETLAWLASAGCDEAQGYFIERPLAAADFDRFAQEWNAARDARGSVRTAH